LAAAAFAAGALALLTACLPFLLGPPFPNWSVLWLAEDFEIPICAAGLVLGLLGLALGIASRARHGPRGLGRTGLMLASAALLVALLRIAIGLLLAAGTGLM
jgi:hypothetical protein